MSSILKIEDINFINSDSSNPLRQLFGYAIAAKRYALYARTRNDIAVVKASGHGLGYFMECEPLYLVDDSACTAFVAGSM